MKKADQDDDAAMCWLPFWWHDKGAVVYQRQQSKLTSVQGSETRTSCVGGSHDLNTARIYHPAQRQADNSAIQGSNSLHRPFFRPPLHPCDDKHLHQWNHQGQVSFQTVCRQPLRQKQTLPCRQRPICCQRLHQPLLVQATMTHLLWCKCPLPKWCGWKSHPGHHQ